MEWCRTLVGRRTCVHRCLVCQVESSISGSSVVYLWCVVVPVTDSERQESNWYSVYHASRPAAYWGRGVCKSCRRYRLSRQRLPRRVPSSTELAQFGHMNLIVLYSGSYLGCLSHVHSALVNDLMPV